MSLTNPNLVYTILAEKIIDKKMNPQTAALFLEEFLKAKAHEKPKIVEKQLSRNSSNRTKEQAKKISKKIRILLIDELDALVTSKQTLLYNIFEWPCHEQSNLFVISIANTMDLPERL